MYILLPNVTQCQTSKCQTTVYHGAS